MIERSPKGRFERYSTELGTGAYKVVYKAIDTESAEEVAWNVIQLKNVQQVDRKRI